jgi:hypothetical protein
MIESQMETWLEEIENSVECLFDADLENLFDSKESSDNEPWMSAGCSSKNATMETEVQLVAQTHTLDTHNVVEDHAIYSNPLFPLAWELYLLRDQAYVAVTQDDWHRIQLKFEPLADIINSILTQPNEKQHRENVWMYFQCNQGSQFLFHAITCFLVHLRNISKSISFWQDNVALLMQDKEDSSSDHCATNAWVQESVPKEMYKARASMQDHQEGQLNVSSPDDSAHDVYQQRSPSPSGSSYCSSPTHRPISKKRKNTSVGRKKARPNFPSHVTSVLKDWLFENAKCPYPSRIVKENLCRKTGISMVSINNW